MDWFEKLTGFAETSPNDVRARLYIDGAKLNSRVNGKSYHCGTFSTPSLHELRSVIELPEQGDSIRVSEEVGDVGVLHADKSNRSAVFQVASQFNCLEMAAPGLVPEDGVGIYENDRTQGPACCICAGAGTIYRNYFFEVDGQVGQTRDRQVNCLALLEEYFGVEDKHYWELQNGYCFPSTSGLKEIEARLETLTEVEYDDLRGKLMAGVQADTEVTVGNSGSKVNQVFCSALPLAYSNIPTHLWNHFPRLILEATYELTFYVALRNLQETGCRRLYLTLVGGGVFGNRIDWIISAIDRSLRLFSGAELDVRIVSYRASKPPVADFVSRYAN